MPSITDLELLHRYMSIEGVLSFASHAEGYEDEDLVIDDCIAFADALIGGILSTKYPFNQLYRSPMLQEFATVIALRTLCVRRGNPIPESLELRYQEIVGRDGFLEMIHSGHMKLLDAQGNVIVGRGTSAPQMSNLTVDRRYPQEKIRVRANISTPTNTRLERDTAHYFGGVIDG